MFETALVNPVEAKVSTYAPVWPVSDRSVKVAVPATAVLVLVPPRVAPELEATIWAVLVVKLPEISTIRAVG